MYYPVTQQNSVAFLEIIIDFYCAPALLCSRAILIAFLSVRPSVTLRYCLETAWAYHHTFFLFFLQHFDFFSRPVLKFNCLTDYGKRYKIGHKRVIGSHMCSIQP